MNKLNFKHLFYFYIVSKEGSVKQASVKLHVSQPTISDQIKLLEEYFDKKLFERRNRSLILTKEGRLCAEYAEKIFALSDEITSRLRNDIQIPKSNVEIGITHFMSQYFIYETILPLFSNKKISIHLRQDIRYRLLADLESEVIDLLFTDSQEGLSSTMSSYRVGLNRTFAVAHKKFLKKQLPFPDCLNAIPFMNYTDESALKYEIRLFFTKYGIAPKVIGEANDIELLQLITEQAIGFTILPEVAKDKLCKNRNIVVLGELKDLQTSVWAVLKSSNKGFCYDLMKNMSES